MGTTKKVRKKNKPRVTKTKSIYSTEKYKKWRKRIFRRDHHTCRLCGVQGVTLNAHHILRKCDHPNLTYVTDNGITLCEKCHYVVTGKEKVFAPLFKHINQHTLSLEFVRDFFERLAKYHSKLLWQFKSYGKWLLIPETLVRHIKRFQSSQLTKPRRKNGTTDE